jgi:hypothetical protein
MLFWRVFRGFLLSHGRISEAYSRGSGTLLPESCRLLLSDESWQPLHVMSGATENEQPAHVLQPTQLDPSQRTGLLEPTEALLDEPSATQADGIAGLSCGPSVQVAAPHLVVPGYMRSHVQLPCHSHKIPGFIGLGRSHGDAARAALLLLVEHQQSRVAFGESVGMTIGIDLGKTVFHFVGVNARGQVAVRRKGSRTQLLRFTSNLVACLIGMEACGGSHFLGRALREQGHDLRLMPAQYVKPYVKTNKNDHIDAEACSEAVTRPTMRFVPIKTDDQLDLQSLRRVPSGGLCAASR